MEKTTKKTKNSRIPDENSKNSKTTNSRIPKSSKAENSRILDKETKNSRIPKTRTPKDENSRIPDEKTENSRIPDEENITKTLVKPRSNPAKAKSAAVTNSKLISALKVIENISHTLGISDREKINFDIEQVSDNELKIRIVNAAANFNTPWFAIKNEEPYIFMPAEILDVVFKMLKTAQKESFELKLERSIWQQMPVDFGDVWRVAMDELSKGDFKKEPDLEKLIAKIKREHPNLFVDMASLIRQ